ncbi:hypothetical protein [Halegenticoccus soli]|uniref:hypothetical protein n=1 Tax=Halegenticoccus soli TaxID=1985678 RepID=UPI000C6E2DE7|nr:hypothetical protein [Halegenticoccus soli]
MRVSPEGDASESVPSYRLDCVACSYAEVVDGVRPALERGMEHEDERGDDHFVEVELIDDRANGPEREP